MTGEGTPTQKGKKIVNGSSLKNWVIFDVQIQILAEYHTWYDIKILIDNQPTDDLCIDYALE